MDTCQIGLRLVTLYKLLTVSLVLVKCTNSTSEVNYQELGGIQSLPVSNNINDHKVNPFIFCFKLDQL